MMKYITDNPQFFEYSFSMGYKVVKKAEHIGATLYMSCK